ncbi:MAG: hypothetical protein FJ207_07465 [Gemmatimonadetes bacterium]|nr:hypothetical protein [Gemmatimonadota bacterium]
MANGISDLRDREDDFTLFDLMSVLLKRRGIILACTFFGTLLGFVVAVLTPIEYSATVSFLPNSGDESAFQSVAGLAQQFGFTLPSAGAERSPEFYQDLMRSRRVLNGLLASPIIVGGARVDLAEHFEIEGESAGQETELMRRYLAQEVTAVSLSRQTGVVTIRVTTDLAPLSAAIGERVLDLIAEFDLETRQSRASAERRFSEDRLGELQAELAIAEDSLRMFLDDNRQFTNSPQLTFEHARLERRVAMRQEVVTAMAQVYERARIDEVRTTPVMTVVDSPEVPALPNRRGRLLKLLVGVTIGTLVGFASALMREYTLRSRAGNSRTYAELQHVLGEVRRDFLGVRRPLATGEPGPTAERERS